MSHVNHRERELSHERLAELDLDAGRILVEANAGTGKTYLLASLFLKAVLAGRPPTAIAAITFTNAATEELRGRLRERLRLAHRALVGAPPLGEEPWWLLVEHACARDGQELVRTRLAEALALMDEAPIATIHGFCLRLLARHPGTVDTEPGLDPEADDRLADAARDFWRSHVCGDPEAWAALRAAGVDAPETLYRRLRSGLSRAPRPWPDAPPSSGDPADLRTRLRSLRETVQRAAEREWDPFLQGLRERQHCLNRSQYKPGWWEQAAEAFDQWRSEDMSLPEKLGQERLERAIKKACKAELLDWLARFELPRMVDAWNLDWARYHTALRSLGHRLLAKALRALPERAARLRTEAGSLSPDDLLHLAAQALEGEQGAALARRIAAEQALLLVDEFQDTDALQYRILRRLEAGGVRLVLIGDPKQAIYAFRGADVHTYLTAREHTPVARRFLLTDNHRSRPAVCEAVNRLFSGQAPFAWQGLEHPPARAARHPDADAELELPAALDPEPDAGLTLWPLAPRSDTLQLAKEAATTLCAASAAAHIAELLAAAREGRARAGGRPVEARDVAVLVRGHDQGQAMREALAQWGIPSAYTSRDSVFGTEAARGLLAWLEALAEPEAPARLRAALADPLTGLDLPSLRRALGADWETWLERSADLSALWRRRGVLATVLRLLEILGGTELAARREGERLLTDLLHLAELLQAEAARLPEPAELARWLRTQVTEPPAGEETVLRLESETDAVRILTVHKAKGLQFPIVYLPFLWSTTPVGRRDDSLLFHDGQDWRIAFEPDDTARALADRERLSEELRLLYVAVTRAQTKLFGWVWPVGEGAGRGPVDWLLYPQARAGVLAGERPFEAADFRKQAREDSLLDWRSRLEALQAAGAIAVAPGPPGVRGRVPQREAALSLRHSPLPGASRDPWRITSYSGILRGEHRTADYDADTEDEPAAQAGVGREFFPPGAATGNFLHRLLEELDYAAPDWDALRPRIEQLRLRFGLPAPTGWWERLVEWMEAILAAPLPEGGSLRDLPRSDRLHEVLFHFRVGGAEEDALNALLQAHQMEPLEHWVPGGHLAGLLTGAIDLVYRRDGRYFIADFKSNLLPDYGPARLRQAMAERRYDLQYLLYVTALHRHLALRLPHYDFDAHLGGVRYLFLRGMTPRHPGRGIFEVSPPRTLIEGFDALLQGDAS